MGKGEKRMFIESSRDIMKQVIAERHPGPTCICDECLIFKHNGVEDAKERFPGSFLVERNSGDGNLPS